MYNTKFISDKKVIIMIILVIIIMILVFLRFTRHC